MLFGEMVSYAMHQPVTSEGTCEAQKVLKWETP